MSCFFQKKLMRFFCLLLLTCFFYETGILTVDAQNSTQYHFYQQYVSKEFHKGRREALRDKLSPNSAAIFFTNPVRNRSNDVDFPYHQDPDFYYLTGFSEPDACLLIFKENQKISDFIDNEYIIISPYDPKEELWNGKQLGHEGVKSVLGINSVITTVEFKKLKIDFSSFDNIYFSGTESEWFKNVINKSEWKTKVNETSLTNFMASLREIKSGTELKVLQKAIDITIDAQIEVMKALEPAMKEYEIQSILEYVFLKNGAKVGFPSIVGAGENSCILHYTSNNKSINTNEMLVVDIGAEILGYTADITRTIPSDGNFSKEEALIYNLVLDAQKAGIEECKPSQSFESPKNAATKIIKDGLLKLGIINNPDDYRQYFMHGVSHYLGLDVHDVGNYGKLASGNVITVEPGIYIANGSPCDSKWWNIGVRIEDDVLITKDGFEILSGKLPKEIKEIEEIMKGKSVFNDTK